MSISQKWLRVTGLLICFGLALALLAVPAGASSPTTSVQITRYAVDGVTIIDQKTVTYPWLAANLPVQGDGTTHYYLQGPVFVDNVDDRWNPQEDKNVQEKDMGALKGTNLTDLCNLVGGMTAGDKLQVKSADGWRMTFDYKNVYQYSPREGPMVLTWFQDGKYPDTGYNTGMRLMWFADTTVNPWSIHAFGNEDWHLAAAEQYWYFYVQNEQKYPTTTGLSGQVVSQLNIFSTQAPGWDLNGDRTGNLGDVTIVGQKWGRTGSPGWIPEDLNRDGTINIGDVVVIGYHWNQTY
jgi:hypothetical protein